MRNYKAECVVECGNLFGKSPRWSIREKLLWWLDVTGRRLNRFDPASGAMSSIALRHDATSFAFTPNGDLLLNFSHGPVIFSPERGVLHALAPRDISPDERFNESRCDRLGRCWTGTFDRCVTGPLGHLYRIDSDLGIVRMDDGIMMSNGIASSLDDRTLYHCDFFSERIFAYDFDPDSGTIGPRRILSDLSRSCGHPSGRVVDAAGCLWVAETDLWRVARFTPDGRRDAFISLPVRRPTGVASGGPSLKTLYITTRGDGTPTETGWAPQPLAGGLFAVELPDGGRAEYDFAGWPREVV
jgi:D-xylonolactonase